MAHLAVPEFPCGSPFVVPIGIEIKNQIHLPPPMLVIVMIAEVGMHVQESTRARLVQTAAFQHVVRYQVGNACQLRKPMHKGGGIQLVNDLAQLGGEERSFREPLFIFVGVFVARPSIRCHVRKLAGHFGGHIRVQKLFEVYMRITPVLAKLAPQGGQLRRPFHIRKQQPSFWNYNGCRHAPYLIRLTQGAKRPLTEVLNDPLFIGHDCEGEPYTKANEYRHISPSDRHEPLNSHKDSPARPGRVARPAPNSLRISGASVRNLLCRIASSSSDLRSASPTPPRVVETSKLLPCL